MRMRKAERRRLGRAGEGSWSGAGLGKGAGVERPYGENRQPCPCAKGKKRAESRSVIRPWVENHGKARGRKAEMGREVGGRRGNTPAAGLETEWGKVILGGKALNRQVGKHQMANSGAQEGRGIL